MGIFYPVRVRKEDPNAGKPPFDDKGNDLSVPVRGHEGEWANKGMTIAHTPHTPESTYDDYGRPEDVPRYKGGNPGGKLIDIDWMKKEYEKKHPKLEQLHKDKYHKDLKISGLSEFDTYMQNMRRGSQKPKSGSIKHHPPHIQKLILGIGKRIRA